MPNHPLVSVIIPNYNHAKYLDQRIQSVLNQTYRNIEVIILDDCSTDNSIDVINQYKSDPRVSKIIVNKENSGNTFLQWDKGIHFAQGELIWIAESDDYCELNMLEILVNAISKKQSASFAYSTTWYVDETGKKWTRFKEGRTQCVSGNSFLKKYLTLENSVQNASCAIFKRKIALSINSDYISYRGIGDYWFWLRLAEQGDVVIINKHLNYFRRHSGAVTQRCIIDGSNLLAERQLVDYIFSKGFFPKWRKTYISRYQANSKKWIVFESEETKNRIAKIWEFDRTYSKYDDLIARIIEHCRRKYLLYL